MERHDFGHGAIVVVGDPDVGNAGGGGGHIVHRRRRRKVVHAAAGRAKGLVALRE